MPVFRVINNYLTVVENDPRQQRQSDIMGLRELVTLLNVNVRPQELLRMFS